MTTSAFLDNQRWSRLSRNSLPPPRWSMRFSDTPIFVPPLPSIDVSMRNSIRKSSKISTSDISLFTIDAKDSITFDLNKISTKDEDKLNQIRSSIVKDYGPPIAVPDPNVILTDLEYDIVAGKIQRKIKNEETKDEPVDLKLKLKFDENMFDKNIINARPSELTQNMDQKTKFLISRAIRTENGLPPNIQLPNSYPGYNEWYMGPMGAGFLPTFPTNPAGAFTVSRKKRKPSKTKACERCHRIKKKCVREHNSTTCVACEKKNIKCVPRIDKRTYRLQKNM